LVQQLLVDLPAYANRENIRTNRLHAYVMLATPPEFNPLSPAEIPPTLTPPPADLSMHQVFFSTLWRRYEGLQVVQHQEHHWLLLAHRPQDNGSASPWTLVKLYSILDAYPSQGRPLEPHENSDGSIARAIRVWLRRCSR
jgi:hypothetical protein